MDKLAIFVEGQTEQLFIEKLLFEVAGKNSVRIEKRKAAGGGSVLPRKLSLMEYTGSPPGASPGYFVLLVDCGTDGRVKSDIRDRYGSLTASGYKAIIGLRDVYPLTHADIPLLYENLPYRIPTKPVQVLFVLSVMEVEAWFLAEHHHFSRISPQITLDAIRSKLGFDPSVDNVELRTHPSADLDSVYQLGARSYQKSKTVVQKTVECLDYEHLYFECHVRVSNLGILVDAINRFFSII